MASAQVYRYESVCIFCGSPLVDEGLAFYAHIEDHPACAFCWQDWMVEIPKDHGGA